jgi:hypothetical protein
VTPTEKNELLGLCRRYLRQTRLPQPLPTSKTEFEKWDESFRAQPLDEEAEEAWLDLSSLAADDPGEAWPLILELAQTKNEDELGTIGAGVLETFVAYHGSTWAAAIENEMFGNPRLIVAMQMVRGIHEHPELAGRISQFFGE